MESSSSHDSGVLAILLKLVERAKKLSKGDVKIGQLKMLNNSFVSQIKKIHGPDNDIINALSSSLIPDIVNPSEEIEKRILLMEEYVSAVKRAGNTAFSNRSTNSHIFIGHGRSPMWRELKDFVNDRLGLPCDEFNKEMVAGITTFERIEDMLDSAVFAFLIMTAEDQHSDATTHARQNVVHEVGLFQGKLGPRKAIILLEDGCNEFSNIAGLSQIRFPEGQISTVFEEIRRVLEREGVIRT